MTEISHILTLLTQYEHYFQTYSALAATSKYARNQEQTDSYFQAAATRVLQTAIFMTSAVNHEAVQSAFQQVLILEQVLHVLSLKHQHSQRAKRLKTKEEGFASITRTTANVLFPTPVVLTVHRRILVDMDSMPTYIQRVMHHTKTKLMKQQLQESRRRRAHLQIVH